MMTSSTDICTMRLQNALMQHMHMRCQEISRIIDDFTTKELHSVYPMLLGDIFGGSDQVGWGLRRTFKSYQLLEYNCLLDFFHPEGSFFKLCYKLMANNFDLKYDFPLSFLPPSVKNMIDDGIVPVFYSDYLKIDSQTGLPAALGLNAFELFVFQFAYHLVRPSGVNEAWADLWDTAYLQLASDYCIYFLRCDGTLVPTVPGYHATRSNMTVLPTSPRLPALFKHTCAHVSYGTQEVWRSELVAQVFIHYWLDIRSGAHGSTTSPQYPQLPSLEHVRVVRNLLKHLHQLNNSCVGDGSNMDEFKRLVMSGSRVKVYCFLRRTMEQWPLDASFRLILETWLSYIQPWRYTNQSQLQAFSDDANNRALTEDRRWLGFIVDNLLAYTVIFRQVINRLSRLDLATPKNANMLARLTKVFSQGHLCNMLADVESCVVESINTNHQYSAAVQQQCLELEPLGFSYVPMFCQITQAEMFRFVRTVAEARQRALLCVHNEEIKQKQPTSLLSWISWTPKEVGDYSLEDRKRAVAHLELSLDQLAAIFRMEPLDVTSMDLTLSSEDNTSTSEPQEETPQAMRERIQRIRYEGDPDLQPIRSWENTCLVRLLHHLATKLNTAYSVEMNEWYQRNDIIGRLARQVLQSPLTTRYYHNSQRVERLLPPRLSLRRLANHCLLAYVLIGGLVAFYLAGCSPLVYTMLLATAWFIYLLSRAALEQWI